MNDVDTTGKSYDEDADNYSAIQYNQQQTKKVESKPSPSKGEAGLGEDDFYNAEQHTYAVVSVEKKRKATKKKASVGEPPVYEMASPGEISWGVHDKQRANLQQ